MLSLNPSPSVLPPPSGAGGQMDRWAQVLIPQGPRGKTAADFSLIVDPNLPELTTLNGCHSAPNPTPASSWTPMMLTTWQWTP